MPPSTGHGGGAQRERLAGRRGEAFSIISIGATPHFRVFGADSMRGHARDRRGLCNAWNGQTRYAAQAPVALVALSRAGDAGIIIVRPVPSDAPPVLGVGTLEERIDFSHPPKLRIRWVHPRHAETVAEGRNRFRLGRRPY